MALLRSPRGCPWDRRQTHATLRGYLIEETYEAVDAITRGDLDALAGELGDVLLQCVFHAQLASERRRFTMTDVIERLTHKLISRHPHVFTPAGRPLSARARARQATRTAAAVRERWAELKAAEQTAAGEAPRVLAGVPRGLPALLRAHKIGGRVASVGFDWPDVEQVIAKVQEELDELREALGSTPHRRTEEMGDLLFTVACLARKLGLDPETTLQGANDKFTRRFEAVEASLQARGLDVHRASQAQLESAWASVKAAERRPPQPAVETGRSRRSPAQPSRRSRPTAHRRGRS